MSEGGRAAFFLGDMCGGSVHYSDGFDASAPFANAQDRRPGVAAVAGYGLTDSRFEIETGVNDTLRFDEGAGNLTATLAAGAYTWTALGTEIGSKMTAAGGQSYTVAVGGTRSFKISALANFSIHWNTGPAAQQSLAGLLGYSTAADDTGAASYTADEARYTGEVFVVIDASKTTANPAAIVAHLSGSTGADFADVKVYGHTGDLGDLRSGWDGTAAYEATLSDRSTAQDENPLQFDLRDPTTASGYAWWAFSWRFEDAAKFHKIHILWASGATWDTTTSRTFDADGFQRGIEDTGGRLDVGNYYPATGLLLWSVELGYSRWPAAAIRSVVHPVARNTAQGALLWVEDFDGALTASASDLATMTDNGRILWCSAGVGPTAWVGSQSAYGSGSIDLRQIR